MNAHRVRLETLVCSVLAGTTVTVIGVLLDAMFGTGIVA